MKESLLKAAWIGNHRAIRGLLQCPELNVNIIDEKGRTALFIPSWKGHIEAIEVLLSFTGIDVNLGATPQGSTPFSVASEKANFEEMDLLIKHKETNVNLGWCKDNWTPGTILCNSDSGATTDKPKSSNLTGTYKTAMNLY